MIYFYETHTKVIDSHASEIVESLIESFRESDSFMEYRCWFIAKFFDSIKAQHFLNLLETLKSHIMNKKKIEECPMLYTLNPIMASLLIIHIVRKIKSKFKSMQVKAMEIEEFLKEAVIRFVDIIQDE